MVLTHKYLKFIGSVLIAIGFLLILPGFGDAFTNIPLGKAIAQYTGYSTITSIILTYTLIPIALIWLGALIHPNLSPNKVVQHTTHHKVTRHITPLFNRLKREREFQFAVLVLLLIIYKVYQFYTIGRHALGGI